MGRSSRWEPEATHRVGPQRVPGRLHLKVGERIGALVISLFEPQQGLLLLAQPDVNDGEGKREHITLLCRCPELVEHSTLLVSIADKLYNARAILEEYRQIGSEVWTRFKRGHQHQLWYFDELIKVFERKCPNWRIVEELKRTVKELAQLSAEERQSESSQTE